MKRLLYFLALIFTLIFDLKTHGQTSSCGDFSITALSSDSTNPNVLQVSIFYAASANSFANYPYISALINCQGDTVATGNMFWFGQFGQSNIDYPLTMNGSIPCEPLTAVFLYSDNFGVTDTCNLLYAGTNSLDNTIETNFRIFPNPTSEWIHVVISEGPLGDDWVLHDLSGKIVQRSMISSQEFNIDLRNIPPGNYLLSIEKSSTKLKHAVRLLSIN